VFLPLCFPVGLMERVFDGADAAGGSSIWPPVSFGNAGRFPCGGMVTGEAGEIEAFEFGEVIQKVF